MFFFLFWRENICDLFQFPQLLFANHDEAWTETVSVIGGHEGHVLDEIDVNQDSAVKEGNSACYSCQSINCTRRFLNIQSRAFK